MGLFCTHIRTMSYIIRSYPPPPPHTSPKQSEPQTPSTEYYAHPCYQLPDYQSQKKTFWLLLMDCNPDIIIGSDSSETWLFPGIYEREILPCDYHIVARKDRKGSPHGGVNCNRRHYLWHRNWLWTLIKSSQQHLLNVLEKHTYHRCSIQAPYGEIQLAYAEEICSNNRSLYQ